MMRLSNLHNLGKDRKDNNTKQSVNGNMLFRFIVFSDSHYGLNDPTNGEDGLYQNRMKLIVDNLIREKEDKGLDFFIGNGDIIHSSGGSFSNRKEALETVIYEYLTGVSTPYYLTPGNHDILNNEDWFDVVGKNRSSSFEIRDFGFILLDSSDTVGGRQICLDEAFLKQKLVEYSNKKGIFFVSHIPRFKGEFLPEASDSPQCNSITNLLENTKNLILCMHGHFHYKDEMQIHENIPILFSGHSSNYGVDYYGYRIYEVHQDGVVTQQWDMTNNKVVNEYIINV